MNFEAASSFLRDAVTGGAKVGDRAKALGLLEVVKKHCPAGSQEREDALMACGQVLGVASMLAGVKEKS